jgi:hypothetical protein
VTEAPSAIGRCQETRFSFTSYYQRYVKEELSSPSRREFLATAVGAGGAMLLGPAWMNAAADEADPRLGGTEGDYATQFHCKHEPLEETSRLHTRFDLGTP